jgi:hypothetical protein
MLLLLPVSVTWPVNGSSRVEVQQAGRVPLVGKVIIVAVAPFIQQTTHSFVPRWNAAAVRGAHRCKALAIAPRTAAVRCMGAYVSVVLLGVCGVPMAVYQNRCCQDMMWAMLYDYCCKKVSCFMTKTLSQVRR